MYKEIQARSISVGGSFSIAQIQEFELTNPTDNSILMFDSSSIKYKVTSISGTNNEIEVLKSPGSITIGLPSDVTVSNSLTVDGQLLADSASISSNLIELNSGISENTNDSGILIERGSTGNNALMIWDESEDKFALGTTTATAGDTGNLVYTASTLIADLEGTADLAIGIVGGSANEVVYQDGTDSTAFVSDANTSTAQYGTFLAQSSTNGPPVWTNVIDGGTY